LTLQPSRFVTWLWLGIFAALGVLLVFLYPDSYQQDGGHHYLFARNAWDHPRMFVGVWSRPLFTFVYAFPALLGYPAAKLFSVLVSATAAYQTFRVAQLLRLERAALAIPFLFLQPSFLLLSGDTMTEPIFALVFVVALRLHLRGQIAAGMVVASLMVLARPEGFFLGILWGIWVLLDTRQNTTRISRLPSTLLLASGSMAWWLAALLITGDPLFIRNNWPPDWNPTQAAYGAGSVLTYFGRMPEIAGPLLCLPLAVGVVGSLFRRRFGTPVSAFLTILVLHSLLRTFGFFGAAGYPRYFVCVSPAIALIVLAGWNEVAGWMKRLPRQVTAVVATLTIALSWVFSMSYIDAMSYTRDAHAVAEMFSWFEANPRPVERVIWSQAYMCILFDCDIADKPPFDSNKEANLEMLRRFPKGTLVFWDGDTGPSWYRIQALDVEKLGYTRLRSQAYRLEGRLLRRWWFHDWGARPQEMHLLYKEY
jgi:hypothetical protein